MGSNSKIVEFPSAARGSATGRRLIPEKLRDARLVLQMSQTDLAERIQVTRQSVSGYEQGSIAPEPTVMARLAAELDQPLGYFTVDVLPDFGPGGPRFFRAVGAETKRRNLKCDVLGKWFVQAVKYFDGLVTFPALSLPSLSPASPSGRYTDEEIETAAEECRKMWGLGTGPLSNVVGLLESKGIVVCKADLPGERIEAFSFWNGPRAFIFLASESESASRLRFDAAHELGHLILHRWVGPEELEDKKKLKEIEQEANRFAGAFLLPRKSFPNEVYTTRLDAFVDLKQRWKVAVQAMVYRCKDLGIFDEYQITNLYKQISSRKWRTREPYDDPNLMPLERPKLLRRAFELVTEHGRKMASEIAMDLALNPVLIERLCGLPPGQFALPAPPDFEPQLKPT